MPVHAAEQILIVDDEHEIADLVELYLQNENYVVHKFYNAPDALACIASTPLDLAILDLMLPETDGLAICQIIREQHTYPIIMLTAKDSEVDKITGLTLGADDYITKPFRPLELIARVKAQLRRYKKYGSSGTGDTNTAGEACGGGTNGSGGEAHGAGRVSDDTLSHSGLLINVSTHEAMLNERPLALTPTEFQLLTTLCENKGIVVSSEQLHRSVWGEEYYSKSSNSIAVHIRHIREKLGDSTDKPRYIKTVWGVGYKIE
jgi:two-component system response regulator VanR